MRKITLIILILAATAAITSAQENGIIKEILRESVDRKVTSMQESIGFDDDKAKQLKEMELKYLLDVQKAETCFLCSTKRRIRKLQSAREEKLQQILPRDQYIKYHSIENDLLNEDNRLWLQ